MWPASITGHQWLLQDLTEQECDFSMLSTSVMHFLVDGILRVAFSTTASFLLYCILFSRGRKETQVFNYQLMGQLNYESLCIAIVLTGEIILLLYRHQCIFHSSLQTRTDLFLLIEDNSTKWDFIYSWISPLWFWDQRHYQLQIHFKPEMSNTQKTVSSLLCPPGCDLMPFYIKDHGLKPDVRGLFGWVSSYMNKICLLTERYLAYLDLSVSNR